LVTERFVRSAEQSFDGNLWLKSFCHIRRCSSYFITKLNSEHAIQAHTPNLPASMIMHDGNTFHPNTVAARSVHVSWETARIRHYVVKTRAEFRQRKIDRGGFWTHYSEEFFNSHNRNENLTPLMPAVVEQLKAQIKEIQSRLDHAPDCPAPPVRIFSTQLLWLRWQCRPYVKGYIQSIGRRWARGFDKARVRMGWARMDQRS
jgi:hypothetical protein